MTEFPLSKFSQNLLLLCPTEQELYYRVHILYLVTDFNVAEPSELRTPASPTPTYTPSYPFLPDLL